jgi:DNA-binding MarR family transcriptional regulator
VKVSLAKNRDRTDEQLELIHNLLAALDPFSNVRQIMTTRMVQIFLLVAEKEGLSVTEYAKRADIPVTSVSRILIDMGERDRNYEDGAGLVESRDNPMNRREKQYYLTPKGRALLAAVSKTTRRRAAPGGQVAQIE